MTVISFLASAAVTGTVAGLGLGASPGQIRDALGGQCIADRRKKSLRLDYGLLEFNLFEGSCETIAMQVHRLANGTEGLVPSVLSAYFQGLSRGIPFQALRDEIERDGTCLLEELQRQHGYRCYRVAKSHVNLYVVDEVAPKGEPLAPGDLWSIMISGRG
ncbi:MULTISPECIES: hypothetical protein [unclassified Kitasatospora]|uniref:hypothetical protein n=1 Tax=unclassified Kitasatospora TaxID=2633591 RepID=UPI0037F8513A